MLGKRYNRPSDFVLIERTQGYFLASLKGKVHDPELLAAWKNFHAFYDPIIRRFAASCGVARELLDDVTQSSWLIVMNDLRRFDCDPLKGSFRAWLFTRVRNASVDQFRETKRRREYCMGVDFDRHEGLELKPDEKFEQQCNKAVLHDALSALEGYVSEFDYKLFLMFRLHEMTAAELSADTGLCESTIRTKLHRTMRMVAEMFEERGYRELLFQCDSVPREK